MDAPTRETANRQLDGLLNFSEPVEDELTIITFNVNGMDAYKMSRFNEWLRDGTVDLLAIQETKRAPTDFSNNAYHLGSSDVLQRNVEYHAGAGSSFNGGISIF
jgi:exonuclease III